MLDILTAEITVFFTKERVIRRCLLSRGFICAVPLSQPFPMMNYFRTSSYCRSEKKSGGEEGNRAASLLLVPSQLSFTCFFYFHLNDQGKLVIR